MSSIPTRPSEQFLLEGRPTKLESRGIEILVRRQQYLKHELDVEGGYPGRGHDQRELDALSWALELVIETRLRGGFNGSPEVARSAEDDPSSMRRADAL